MLSQNPPSIYWSLPKNELLSKLKTSESGITDEDARDRLKIFGSNSLAQPKRSLLISFASQFLNPLILILFFASLVSALLKDATNFVIINTIILISGSLDFYQQHKAENAAEKLKQRVSLTASIVRHGREVEIPVTQVVPGDIVNLTVGDIVPADCRLLWGKELDLNQSALTGEAYPQTKNENVQLDNNTAVVDRINCVFMGTNVISGEGKAVVVQTGKATEIGKISSTLVEKRPETEFQKQTKSFGYLLMKITFSLVVFVFFVNTFVKHDLLDSFLFALALAIGLTPELLPLVITINLSKGGQEMSKHGVIVKDLPAIQNLGGMEILCTDKTGTLTEDKIKLEKYQNLVGDKSQNVLLYGYLNSHYQTGIKNPLEKAILSHHEVNVSGYTKIDEIPFDFIRKRLSVVLKHDSQTLIITKGAPEAIFAICKYYLTGNQKHLFGEQAKHEIHQTFTSLSSQGFRVLAVASKQIEEKASFTVKDEHDLALVGLMAFLDPAKESAALALENTSKAGITLKILTGDNELVTQKICQDLNLPVQGTVTGAQIDSLSDEALAHLAEKTTIFARVDPNQKRRIISALKRSGKTVGFMGDGINDAPSLREADIGISVNNAVDVAKESADLILLHKDLNVLKMGVYEGRKTYSNIMKYIMMGTSSNFGNMFSMAGASLLLPFLPMLPTQILLNNLLYDLSQLAIPSDNVDPEIITQPKRWNLNYIEHFMMVFGPLSSIFDFLTFGGLWFIFKSSERMFQTGWFIESIVTQSLIIFSIRTKKVPFIKSKPSLPLTISTLMIVAIGLTLPLLPYAQAFSFVRPNVSFYLFISLLLMIYFVSVEITKSIFFRKYIL